MFGRRYFGGRYFGQRYFSGGGSLAPAVDVGDEVWNYLLPNGKTAKQTVIEIHAMLIDLHLVHGLTLSFPLSVSATARSAGTVAQTISEAAGVVTVTRTP